MKNSIMWFSVGVLVVLSLVDIGVAECPNGCSGAGTCGPRDMCTCFKNHHGNDCSLKTCPFAYAHVDTPKGDLDMSGGVTDTWILTNSQIYPAQTYEYFNPSAGTDEAHFYMECANKGVCDRATGLCTCFEGYEGSACRRASCPNKCSGHGTCESISEMGTQAAGTLVGSKSVYGARTYNLWDAHVTYGCRCDPWYTGADCSLRRCKVGVDPMYEAAGTEVLETFIIHATMDASSETLDQTNSYFRLRVFDYWGESYVTDRVLVKDDASVTTAPAALQTAIEALPNSVFSTVLCLKTGTGLLSSVLSAKLANHKGVSITCQFSSNPGALRFPEFHSYHIGTSATKVATTVFTAITGTSFKGYDFDWTITKSAVTANSIANAATAVTTSGNMDVANSKIIKVKDQLLLMTAGNGGTTLTLAYAWMQAAITTATPIFSSSATVAASGDSANTWAVGSKVITTAAAATIAVGDVLFIQNQIFTCTAVSGSTVTVDRGFSGKVADGAAIAADEPIYKITMPTQGATGTYTFVSECSGRGLCDATTGVCACFPGYTNDNCDTQSIISV